MTLVGKPKDGLVAKLEDDVVWRWLTAVAPSSRKDREKFITAIRIWFEWEPCWFEYAKAVMQLPDTNKAEGDWDTMFQTNFGDGRTSLQVTDPKFFQNFIVHLAKGGLLDDTLTDVKDFFARWTHNPESW